MDFVIYKWVIVGVDIRNRQLLQINQIIYRIILPVFLCHFLLFWNIFNQSEPGSDFRVNVSEPALTGKNHLTYFYF